MVRPIGLSPTESLSGSTPDVACRGDHVVSAPSVDYCDPPTVGSCLSANRVQFASESGVQECSQGHCGIAVNLSARAFNVSHCQSNQLYYATIRSKENGRSSRRQDDRPFSSSLGQPTNPKRLRSQQLSGEVPHWPASQCDTHPVTRKESFTEFPSNDYARTSTMDAASKQMMRPPLAFGVSPRRAR